MKTKAARIITILLMVFGLAPTLHASVPATGEFTAAKACQAYQSMRKKTNPGCVRLDIGRSYPVFESGMAEFMQTHSGETVTTQSFLDAVDRAFHDEAHKRLQLSCNGGKLVDIYIRLPKEIDEESSLSELIKRSPANFKNACGEKFTVDVIGQ